MLLSMMNKNITIKLIFGAIFTLFYQIIIAPRTSFANTNADMALILTIWVALTCNPKTVVIFGFAVGLLVGALTPIELGWASLLLAIIGYLVCIIKNKIVIDPLPSKIATLICSIFVYNFFYQLFTNFDLFIINFSYMITTILFASINTAIAGIIVFIIIRYRHILRKLI